MPPAFAVSGIFCLHTFCLAPLTCDSTRYAVSSLSMSVILLILPDFLLIALGWILLHKWRFTPAFFRELEKLVYFLLFPALLFQSITKTPISLSDAYVLLLATAALTGAGILFAWLAVPVLRPDPSAHASLSQTAYRFNTYIGLSIASSLGDSAQTIMAILVGFAVPMVNVAAVHSLARQNGRILLEIVRNPLILATSLGLLWNLASLPIPDFINISLTRLGACAIAIGLLCVGATLSMRATQGRAPLVSWMISVRLLIMPIVAIAIGFWLDLSLIERQVLLLFAALPTASSAHVLAARMGGQPQLVAITMSMGTVLSAATLPVWLMIGERL